MKWRWLFLIGGPLGFAYALQEAANAADTVDLDLFSAFVYLLVALPLGLMVAAAYSSLIGEWIGEAVWMRFSENPGYDHPHWLVSLTGWLERHQCRLLLRWVCFLAVQLIGFSEWSILYQRGLGAAREGSWLERYFARRLYPFPNALNALKAAEALARHGIHPRAHPDTQVQLFLLRAGLPEKARKKPACPAAETEPAPSIEAAGPVADVVPPGNLNPLPSARPLVHPLLRNPSIALFEGAEPSPLAWNAALPQKAESPGAHTQGRQTTTVQFAPPPPAMPFEPVQLDASRYRG